MYQFPFLHGNKGDLWCELRSLHWCKLIFLFEYFLLFSQMIGNKFYTLTISPYHFTFNVFKSLIFETLNGALPLQWHTSVMTVPIHQAWETTTFYTCTWWTSEFNHRYIKLLYTMSFHRAHQMPPFVLKS